MTKQKPVPQEQSPSRAHSESTWGFQSERTKGLLCPNPWKSGEGPKFRRAIPTFRQYLGGSERSAVFLKPNAALRPQKAANQVHSQVDSRMPNLQLFSLEARHQTFQFALAPHFSSQVAANPVSKFWEIALLPRHGIPGRKSFAVFVFPHFPLTPAELADVLLAFPLSAGLAFLMARAWCQRHVRPPFQHSRHRMINSTFRAMAFFLHPDEHAEQGHLPAAEPRNRASFPLVMPP